MNINHGAGSFSVLSPCSTASHPRADLTGQHRRLQPRSYPPTPPILQPYPPSSAIQREQNRPVYAAVSFLPARIYTPLVSSFTFALCLSPARVRPAARGVKVPAHYSTSPPPFSPGQSSCLSGTHPAVVTPSYVRSHLCVSSAAQPRTISPCTAELAKRIDADLRISLLAIARPAVIRAREK